MKRGGIIEGAIWRNPKVRRLSSAARLLYLYILACPHANSVGAYVLHPGYVLADLEHWGLDSLPLIETTLTELEAELIARDHDTNLIVIRGYWGHNVPASNPNVAKAMVRQALQLPKSPLRRLVVDALAATGNKWLITVAKELRKTQNYLASETVPRTVTETVPQTVPSTLSKAGTDSLRRNRNRKEETPEPTNSAGVSSSTSEVPSARPSDGAADSAAKPRPTAPTAPSDGEPDDIPFNHDG